MWDKVERGKNENRFVHAKHNSHSKGNKRFYFETNKSDPWSESTDLTCSK